MTRMTQGHGQPTLRSLVKRHKLAGSHPGTRNILMMLVDHVVINTMPYEGDPRVTYCSHGQLSRRSQ
jgi:hypothetical protein